MTKAQIVDAMAKDAGITKKQAESALKSFTESVKSSLQAKEKVQLVGFGTFSTSERAGRVGRNPSTGGTVNIPAKTVAKFKAGSDLADSLN